MALTDLLEHIDLRCIEVSNRLAINQDQRAQLGQFFTPDKIARFMASMFKTGQQNEVHLLDAGGGNGILTAAVIERICTQKQRPAKIVSNIWEIDSSLALDLNSTIDLCRSICEDAKIELVTDIRYGNFIEDAVHFLNPDKLFQEASPCFNLAILNPPYRKLRSDTKTRALLSSVGIETSNLYSAFVWLATELLCDGGELVAITPRSYMNGTYFRPFRKRFRKLMSIRRIHIYESRNTAFANDDVLQENAIMYAVKEGGSTCQAQITTSESPDDTGHKVHILEQNQVIDPHDSDSVIHVVSDDIEASIDTMMRAFPNTLADLGVTVSTGRVVDFRVRERLHLMPEDGDAPLIFPRHFVNGFVAWPEYKPRKPNSIVVSSIHDPLLLPSGWYVLVKRFSAKEEHRRIVAALFDPERINADSIGFDNKLNVLHCNNSGLSPSLAKGIVLFLNSTFVDAYFRQISGHTQVNASDLRSIRFPILEELERIGTQVTDQIPLEEEINWLLQKEIFSMSKSDDPIAAKQKVEDAKVILKAINAPNAQQNERSALTLLGLLNLKTGDEWSDVSAPLRGVTELMEWMEENYGKKYAANTRETIRRQTLHQFIEMGIVKINPNKPDRPINSPNTVYQIESTTLKLLRHYHSNKWNRKLTNYNKSMLGRNRLQTPARQLQQIPVTLPNGSEINISAGGQNVLIKEIIEKFASRFTPGGRVVYVGDASEKNLCNETEYLEKLGVEIDPHGKMPDVVIHYKDKDWLVLVEAVTSHGPVNILRHNQLKDLFAGSQAGLVFVTAFLDRKAMREYLPDIDWETEVWVADAPDHLIHFNGERFLGPYEI